MCAAAPAGFTYLRPPCSHGPPPQREPRSATTTKQPCEDHAANRAAARSGIRQAGAASAHLRLGGGAAMPRVESACAGAAVVRGAKMRLRGPAMPNAPRCAPPLRRRKKQPRVTARGEGSSERGGVQRDARGAGSTSSAHALPDSATGSISCASAVRGDTTGCPVAKVAAGVPRAAHMDVRGQRGQPPVCHQHTTNTQLLSPAAAAAETAAGGGGGTAQWRQQFEAGAPRRRISAPWQNAGGALQPAEGSAFAGANYCASCRGQPCVCGGVRGAPAAVCNVFARAQGSGDESHNGCWPRPYLEKISLSEFSLFLEHLRWMQEQTSEQATL